jgi:hypothetical protein
MWVNGVEIVQQWRKLKLVEKVNMKIIEMICKLNMFKVTNHTSGYVS